MHNGNDRPLVDESALQELRSLATEDEPNIMEQLLGMFLREAPVRIMKIRRAVETRDERQIAHMAHLLKGSCKQLGLVELVHICQSLDDAPGVGARADVHELLGSLESAFQQTKEFLESKYFFSEN